MRMNLLLIGHHLLKVSEILPSQHAQDSTFISHSNPLSRPGSLSVSTLSQQLLHVSCYANQGPESPCLLIHSLVTCKPPLSPADFCLLSIFPSVCSLHLNCHHHHRASSTASQETAQQLPSLTCFHHLLLNKASQRNLSEISGCLWPMPPICLQCCPKHLGKRKISKIIIILGTVYEATNSWTPPTFPSA